MMSVVQSKENKNCTELRQSARESRNVRPKTMSVGRRTNMRQRDQLFKEDPEDLPPLENESSSTLMRNLHSSHTTGRLWKMRTSWNGELYSTVNTKLKTDNLRIRGSKAPSKEMVDHFQRNSMKELRRM